MSDPINALVRFFVEVEPLRKRVGDDEVSQGFSDSAFDLAEALGVELGADADTIEMAVRSKLTVPPPAVRRFYEDKTKG